MPDARTELDEGIRHERSGALPQAMHHYQQAVRLTHDPRLLSEAYRRLADANRGLCSWGDAVQAARRSAEIAESAGLNTLLAEALNAEALIHQSRGDVLPAASLYERILSLSSDDRIHGIAHQNLGTIAAGQGDLAAAERHLLQSYRHFQQAAYLRGVAIALINYAGVSRDQGNLPKSIELCDRAIAAARTVEDLELLALAVLNQGEALSRAGDIVRAEALASSALGYFSLMENPWRRIECLRLLGDLRREQGFDSTAVQCYTLALSLADTLGATLEAAQLRDRLNAIQPEAEP